ncbi:MAG: Hpt domain-containing protein [Bacteriovoracaceae bacterium]|nr:Hpt domain-containing protein [Bacteriovoracaceae bacterium]
MSDKFIVKIDPDLKEIIPTFLKNREKDIQNIKVALESSDYAAIESIAHKLAGNAGSYGLDDLGEIGASLEAACQTNDVNNINQYCQQYAQYLSNLEIQFE